MLALLLALVPVQDLDLKYPLDQSVRWLRSTQDLETGAYAGSVDATAWALRAFHECPRRYRRIDGPFVDKALDFLVSRQRGEGVIADEGAQGREAAGQTALAVMALKLYADPGTKDALARALAFLGRQEGLPLPDADLGLPATREEAVATANRLMAARAEDHSWAGPRGKVIETARNIVILSVAGEVAKPASKPGAEARALPRFEEADRARAQAALEKGARFLLARQEAGRFEFKPGIPDAGVTAMALGALQGHPEPRPKDVQQAIDEGLAWLASLQRKDGSIHDGAMANYVTSASLMALARSGSEEHRPVVARARDFLIALQADEAEGYSPDHPFYGGNSYGNEERPDLSNVQMALEALAASGLEKGHETYKRALVFLSRCQNDSETNTFVFRDGDAVVVAGTDGGAAYGPGDSKAGFIELEDGRKVARSYGSMTYALLKSYIFAGVAKDDPRMKACWEWLRKNYTLDVNPGFEHMQDPTAAYQGLFYYFHTMAKALDLHGEETIVDAQGRSHAWRKELCGRLVAMQSREDGSWVNRNSSRWWESNPVLATSYALLALEAAMPK